MSETINVTTRKPELCFLCVGNSCRSVMAMGWAQHLLGDRYTVYSAGSNPAQHANKIAVQVMSDVGIDVSRHVPSKLGNRQPDYVVTVCGDEHDVCPTLPKDAISLHIPFKDPSHQPDTVPLDEQIKFYCKIRDDIRDMVVSLPQLFNQQESQQ